MEKNYLFLTVVAAAALAGCSNSDFTGDSTLRDANEQSVISFEGSGLAVTRATSNTGTVAQMLDGQFKIYGVKSGASAGSALQKVFVDYSVWDAAGRTTSNTNGWEYVGASGATGLGTGSISLTSEQTIKYWDHSAADYRFVAGSPISAFTYTVNSTTNAIESAAITGLAGHITANPSGPALTTNPVYIAQPLIVTEPSYNSGVTFNFVRQQARVRVGVFETIPGYVISDIHFYTNGAATAESGKNIILTSATSNYFVGGSAATGTVTYSWGATPSYTFAYDDASLTKAQNWYAGALTLDAAYPLATTSTGAKAYLFGTDEDMDANGYFTVMPTPSATTAAPLLIKCDYTLQSVTDGTNETIKVTGATAAVPAAFSKWEPNTSYTYLFKISDNTNGKTNPDKDAVGLYPITLDAVAVAETNTQGTITVVSTPSITTYQSGSVTNEGVRYVPNTAIYATVANEAGVLQSLKALDDGNPTVGMVQVYSLASSATEAELQVTRPTTKVATTVGDAAAMVNNVTLPANQHLTFTPTAAGYYAIEYITATSSPVAYAYKIIQVVSN